MGSASHWVEWWERRGEEPRSILRVGWDPIDVLERPASYCRLRSGTVAPFVPSEEGT